MERSALRRVAACVLLGLVGASPLALAQQSDTRSGADTGTRRRQMERPMPGQVRATNGMVTHGDNTGKNAEAGPTADQQNNTKRDVELTAQIRRAVVSDKSLSTSAHNVKIISISGVVTLKGPVRSLDEKKAVTEKASQIAGAGNVRDELSIAPKD
jgi:hyperosmotically inducible periplasmic protein